MVARAGMLLSLVVLLGACLEAKPPTQVMVVVAAEPSIDDDTVRLAVRVRGKPRDQQAAFELSLEREFKRSEGLAFPLSITIAPVGGDETRLYEFVATAFDGAGGRIGEVRAISGFIAERSLVLALSLDEACRSTSCQEESLTCRAGDCVDAHIDPQGLPSFDPDDPAESVVADAVEGEPDPEMDGSVPGAPDASVPGDGDGDETDDDDEDEDMDASPGTDAGGNLGHDAGQPCEEGEIRDSQGHCIVPQDCAADNECPEHFRCVDNACAACVRGYALRGNACDDVDECVEGVSGCNGTCTNRDGTFDCRDGKRNCIGGTVPSGGYCLELGCAYYQRLPGPDPAGENCKRTAPVPPSLVGPLDEARLFGGSIPQTDFSIDSANGALAVEFLGEACALARGESGLPVPPDWFLGYACKEI